MAKMNMEKMRQKLQALNEKGNGGSDYWKPKDGTQTIRILPLEDGDPFVDFYFHYNLGNGGFLCPRKNFGDDCKVCEFGSELYRTGDRTQDPATISQAKDLFARQRFFSPVVVRGEEDKGVRIWGYGRKVYEYLLKLSLNPEYGDITCVDTGVDLTLNYGKPAGQKFPHTDLHPQRKSTPLSTDSTKVSEWLNNIPDVSSMHKRKTSAEVQAILDEHLLSDTDAEENSSEITKYGEGTSETTVLSKVDEAFSELPKSDLDAEFEQLLGSSA
jgi:hypothetical protein